MRTGKITLNGVEYPLAFSLRVVRRITERYGDMAALDDRLDAKNGAQALDEALWVLSELMKAGEKHARDNGQEPPAPLTVDDLLDRCDISDFRDIKVRIVETIVNGRRATVEVETEKNGQATPDS